MWKAENGGEGTVEVGLEVSGIGGSQGGWEDAQKVGEAGAGAAVKGEDEEAHLHGEVRDGEETVKEGGVG